MSETETPIRVDGSEAQTLEQLANREKGNRRVRIDPSEVMQDPRSVTHMIGTVDEIRDKGLNGRKIMVFGENYTASQEGSANTRRWRVKTDRGTFKVSYTYDSRPNNPEPASTVLVKKISD